jgi:predicted RNA methylase
VDYIVKQTVGKITEGKTPKQVSKLRILDPACGSGSFLINAYQFLLDWHHDWYFAHKPETWTKGRNSVLVQTTAGWKLTIAERKRILLDNIYGVDIDPQAVEVTKLSLLLKVLEGESEQTIQPYLRLFSQRALPDLGNNIKCGNSLIGPEFYSQKELPLLSDEDRLRINIFDWNAEYAAPMKAGGFDALIGNPPYGATIYDPEASFIRNRYKASTKELDTYSIFIEKAIELTKKGALIGMIVPTGWYSGAKFSTLRRIVAQRTDPIVFVNLPYDVFKAWVDTTVFVIKKSSSIHEWPRQDNSRVYLKIFPKRYRIRFKEDFDNNLKSAIFSKWFSSGGDEFLTYADSYCTTLINRILSQGRPLGEITDVQRGVTPFELTTWPNHANSRRAFNGTIKRYIFEDNAPAYIRFDESLAEPKPEKYFIGPRILLRELISRKFRLMAVKVEQNFVTNKSIQSIIPLAGGPSLNFILGILNSRLISWYFLRRSNIAQRDDFPKIVLKEARLLPIKLTDCSVKEEKIIHDRLVGLVENLMKLNHEAIHSRFPNEQESLSRHINAIDIQIDQIVYQLYGLTDEEIRIVEEATAPAHSDFL